MKKLPPRMRSLERLAKFTMHAVMDRHPEISDRLGSYAGCRYLIDVRDTPFILLIFLKDRDIHVYRRSEKIRADAIIRGSFVTLVRLAQGGGDGDALFFSRDITIEGNTEAVLALRNALDGSPPDIIHDSLEALGFWGFPFKLGYKVFRGMHPIITGMLAR